MKEGKVVIDAVADDDPEGLRNQLVALGMTRPAMFGLHVSDLMPIDALDRVAGLASVRLARPAFARTFTGAVTSQRDMALSGGAEVIA